MAVEQQQAQTLAAFVLEKEAGAKRLLEAIQKVDAVDDNVKVVDSAIAERTKFAGRVKVHQSKDMGAMKGGVHGAAIGVVVGALVAGPAGPSPPAPPAGCSTACAAASTTSASTTSGCARSPRRSTRARASSSSSTRAAGPPRSG